MDRLICVYMVVGGSCAFGRVPLVARSLSPHTHDGTVPLLCLHLYTRCIVCVPSTKGVLLKYTEYRTLSNTTCARARACVCEKREREGCRLKEESWEMHT